MKNTSSIIGVVLLAMALVVPVPVVLAQAPGQADLQVDPYYADYVATMAYWFESVAGDDWEVRLAQALVVPPDQSLEQYDEDDVTDEEPSWVGMLPGSERVVLMALPNNSWWIDTWRQDLDGSWVKVPSWHPSNQLPGPVAGDLVINGKLPAPYVIRVYDQSGAVLLNGARLLVVSWTNGNGGTWSQEFDVASLPMATEAQLSRLPW